MLFKNTNAHTCPFLQKLNILKFGDKVALENCMKNSKSLPKKLPKIVCDLFTLSFESHSHNISWARYSVTTNAIYICNFLQSQHQ